MMKISSWSLAPSGQVLGPEPVAAPFIPTLRMGSQVRCSMLCLFSFFLSFFLCHLFLLLFGKVCWAGPVTAGMRATDVAPRRCFPCANGEKTFSHVLNENDEMMKG
jgi:hypothetical protein